MGEIFGPVRGLGGGLPPDLGLMSWCCLVPAHCRDWCGYSFFRRFIRWERSGPAGALPGLVFMGLPSGAHYLRTVPRGGQTENVGSGLGYLLDHPRKIPARVQPVLTCLSA